MIGVFPLPWAGQWHDCHLFRESGILWANYRGFATGLWTGAAACLERAYFNISPRRRLDMAKSWLEKLVEQHKDRNGTVIEATDEDLQNLVPHVYELLTSRIKMDKRNLDPATLLLFARSGSWHACLSQRGLDLKWWAESTTWAGLMPCLESAVAKESQATPSLNGRKRRSAEEG